MSGREFACGEHANGDDMLSIVGLAARGITDCCRCEAARLACERTLGHDLCIVAPWLAGIDNPLGGFLLPPMAATRIALPGRVAHISGYGVGNT